MSKFKKGEIIEILDWGSSYSKRFSCSKTLIQKNNIPESLLSDWESDVKDKIKLPIKANIIDVFEHKDYKENYYLLKIHNSKWYIIMTEKSHSKPCIKKINIDYKETTNQTSNIKHIINNTTTIVILPNGNKGIAKLHPQDEFNEYEGFRIAYARANNIDPFLKKNTSYKYKVGQHITKGEAIDILEKGGKVKVVNLIYHLGNKNELLYDTSTRKDCISSGFNENFYKEYKYVIYELPTKTSNFDNVIKPLSDYTDDELLEELKNRLIK